MISNELSKTNFTTQQRTPETSPKESNQKSPCLMHSNSQSNIKKIPHTGFRNIFQNFNYIPTPNNIIPIQDNLMQTKVNEDETSKIQYLKKSYENRISQLIIDFQKILESNGNNPELIKEIIFKEKEKIIADLYEQNAIFKSEYDENKLEMIRLQKVISVLEIEIKKYEKKLKKKIAEIQKINDQLSNLQAENFDINLKLKFYQEQKEKNNTNDCNISKDLTVSNNEFIIMKNEIPTDKSMIKLTEELNQLKYESDHKLYLDMKANLERTTKEYDNKINEINLKYNEDIEKIKIDFNKQIENISKEKSELENAIKKIKLEYDNILGENSYINNKLKINEQIIILLRSKISSFKLEMSGLKKFIIESFNNYRMNKDNLSNTIFNKIHFFYNEFNYEEYHLIKNNYTNLKNEISNLQIENKNLIKVKEKLEKEKNILSNQLNKINIQNEILVEEKNNYMLKNNIQQESYKINKNLYNELKFNNKEFINQLLAKIYNIKSKYLKDINFLKQEINIILTNYKRSNSHNSNSSEKIIKNLKDRIKSLQGDNDNYINAISKKNKKIKELQDALSKSFMSLTSGMKNIKIANLLDNEVKEFLKNTK